MEMEHSNKAAIEHTHTHTEQVLTVAVIQG